METTTSRLYEVVNDENDEKKKRVESIPNETNSSPSKKKVVIVGLGMVAVSFM
jgi:hypothetical protein